MANCLMASRCSFARRAAHPFFAYRMQQALALSASEEQHLTHAVAGLRQESAQPTDAFSQQLLSTQLDVLLQYASRAYYRQFFTEPASGPDLLSSKIAGGSRPAYFFQGTARGLPGEVSGVLQQRPRAG